MEGRINLQGSVRLPASTWTCLQQHMLAAVGIVRLHTSVVMGEERSTLVRMHSIHTSLGIQADPTRSVILCLWDSKPIVPHVVTHEPLPFWIAAKKPLAVKPCKTFLCCDMMILEPSNQSHEIRSHALERGLDTGFVRLFVWKFGAIVHL